MACWKQKQLTNGPDLTGQDWSENDFKGQT